MFPTCLAQIPELIASFIRLLSYKFDQNNNTKNNKQPRTRLLNSGVAQLIDMASLENATEKNTLAFEIR